MQHSWTFDFPALSHSEKDLELFLALNTKELGIFLSYYYKKEGAVAENVSIQANFEFESKNTGCFTLEFDLVFFNACLAIHDKAKEKMKITFKVDVPNQKLQLKGPFWPSREMDEI
jgi:hypothetical protein